MYKKLEINKEIKKVYSLFSEGNFIEAQKLNNKILEAYPNQMYAKRYQSMLDKKLSNGGSENSKTTNSPNSGISEKIAKVRGKSLKCPHCCAKITFSSLNSEQQKAIKSGDYNNLEVKCPYCHTQFVLQKRKANSLLGLKIGNIATIDGKKYRATGYSEYKGTWYEGRYSGRTHFLEWLLLGEDNSFYYFSEGKSFDEGKVEYEFELSQKVTPDFIVPISSHVYTKATVSSVYGENSKQYVIGEKTVLYEFNNSGESYVLEKEGVGSQREAGVYKIKNLSRSEAFALFGKEDTRTAYSGSKMGVIPKLLIATIAFPIFVYAVFQPLFNVLLEDKKQVKLSDLEFAKKVILQFNNPSLGQERKTSSTRYDYGGVKTYYSRNIGLKFSLQTEEDKKILEKIKTLDSENQISKMFNGNLYKLK